MHITDTLTLLAIFSVCAWMSWFFALRMKALGLSATVAELAIGFVMGNWIVPLEETKTLSSISEIGAMILFFIVGLHISIREVKTFGTDIARVVVIGATLAPAAVFLLSGPLGITAVDALFAAATVMATGVGVVTRVLREHHGIGTKSGRFLLACSVVEDFPAILLLSFASSFAKFGTFNSHTYIAAGSLVLCVVAAKFLLRRTKDFYFPLTLTLPCIIIAGWLTQTLGLTSLLGAVMAGLICRHSTRKIEEYESYIMPLMHFFIPIFFVMVGMRLKAETFMHPESWILALALIAVAFISKGVCYFGIGKAAQKAGIDRTTVVLGMIPRGLPGLVFATTALNAGLIGNTLFSSLIIMVTVTNVIGLNLLSSRLKKKN